MFRWDQWIKILDGIKFQFNQKRKPKKVHATKIDPKLSKCLRLLTYGGLKGNKAVWAFILKEGRKTIAQKNGSIEGSAVLEGEVTAVLKGLKECIKINIAKVVLVTDSYYVSGPNTGLGGMQIK